MWFFSQLLFGELIPSFKLPLKFIFIFLQSVSMSAFPSHRELRLLEFPLLLQFFGGGRRQFPAQLLFLAFHGRELRLLPFPLLFFLLLRGNALLLDADVLDDLGLRDAL